MDLIGFYVPRWPRPGWVLGTILGVWATLPGPMMQIESTPLPLVPLITNDAESFRSAVWPDALKSFVKREQCAACLNVRLRQALQCMDGPNTSQKAMVKILCNIVYNIGPIRKWLMAAPCGR